MSTATIRHVIYGVLFPFLLVFTLSVLKAQSSLCTPPSPHALCTPPTTFDVVRVATGTTDWQTLTGVSADNVTQKIKITGSGKIVVPNGDLLLNSATAVIYLDGPTLVVNNGNIQLTATGSRFLMNGGKLQIFGNFQQTINTVECIVGTKVEVGEEEADGLFNSNGNTKSAANWQNDGGYRYLNNICVNVTQDFQLQSTGDGQNTNGLDVIVGCCFEIGDRGMNHATPTAFQQKDGDDTGSWQNSRIQKIYNTDIVIANGNYQNSNDTMIVCNVDVKINVTGSFQINSGKLLGDGLCIAAEDIIENSGVWAANVSSWYSFKQSSIGRNQPITGSIPTVESAEADILTSCFTNCCAALGVCTPPTIASVAHDTATCTNGVANANAWVAVRGITGMAKYAYRTNATDSLWNTTATASTADSIRLSNLTNPSASRTYTFRIWKTDTTCYNDTTVVLPPSVCAVIPCSAPTVASVQAYPATCTNGSLSNNAALALRGIQGMASYAYNTSGTAGLFAANATASTADSIKLTGLTTPSVPTTYYFRIYKTDSTCYKDTSLVLNPAFCGQIVIDSVINADCDPYQDKWLAKVYFHYTSNRDDTVILNGLKFPRASGTHTDSLFCGLFDLGVGTIVFDIKFAADTTMKDTFHFVAPTQCGEIDPIGFFYCSQTGRIVPGCDIQVTGPGNVTFFSKGCLGRYQWIVDAPGLYTMTHTLPPGYSVSTTCLPGSTPYDPLPASQVGDTILLGNDQDPNNPRFLTSKACTPHYLQFQLDFGDPIIAANNIALNCNCDTITTSLAPNQTHTLTAESAVSNIVWQRDTGTGFFNLPTNSDNNNNEHTLIVSLRGTYRHSGTLASGCPYESPCEHKFDNVVDLTLDKSVNTTTTTQGSNVVFSIKVKNESLANATGVVVKDSLPVGMTFISASPNGVYDVNTKLWTIGNLNAGDSITLSMTVRLDSVGVHYNTAEIHRLNQTDSDSSPNNQSTTEDDIDRVCVSIPIPVCTSQGKTLTLTIPSGLSNTKWFRNGTEIAGQTSNALLVNQIGDYTFTANELTCPVEGCCPVKVVEGNCILPCKPVICLPVTVMRQ